MRRATIVYDPSLVMLAFRHAEACAPPSRRKAVRRAMVRWQDDATPVPVAGGLPNHVGVAIGCADRYGVGDLLLAAVSDVASTSAQTDAEEALGRELTRDETRVVEQAVAFAKKGADEESIFEWVRRQMPTTPVVDAAMQAARDTRDAIRAAPENMRQAALDTMERAADASVKVLKGGKEMIEAGTQPVRDISEGITLGMALTGIAALGLGYYYLFGSGNR